VEPPQALDLHTRIDALNCTHVPHELRRCLIGVPLWWLYGCSFLFVETAPTHHAELRYFDCTSSRVMPVLDTIGAGLYGVRTAVAAAVSEREFKRYGISKPTDVAVSLGVTALFTTAAIYGYTATRECADAKRGLAGRSDPATMWAPPPL
jgi:hypothetical protein